MRRLPMATGEIGIVRELYLSEYVILIDGRPCDVAFGEAGCDDVRVVELWTRATVADVEMEKHCNRVATLAYAEALAEAATTLYQKQFTP